MCSPSGQDVDALHTNSISMLDILVGLARVMVSRPRTMPDAPFMWERCLPVASPLRRKTTDSVRRISSVFLVALGGAAMAVGAVEDDVRDECMAMRVRGREAQGKAALYTDEKEGQCVQQDPETGDRSPSRGPNDERVGRVGGSSNAPLRTFTVVADGTSSSSMESSSRRCSC